MHKFDRQPAPAFWAQFEQRWWKMCADDPGARAKACWHRWQLDNRRLSAWFHECVLPEGAPPLCAYCGVLLDVSSPKTIDHFIPEWKCPDAALSWENLYPACTCCNVKYKATRWSLFVARPDIDPVEEWFDFDFEDGAIDVAAEHRRNAATRLRVLRTIKLFGLNTPERRAARRVHVKALRAHLRIGDVEFVREQLNQGSYPSITRRFLLAHDILW